MITADDIKDRVDPVSIYRGLLKLEKAGSEWAALCPFHSERTPSFKITPKNGLWHCHGACGEGGDVLKFVQKFEHLTFPNAVRRVAELGGVDISTEPHAMAPGAPKRQQPAVEPKQVAWYPYTDERGNLLYEVVRIEPGRNGKSKDFAQRRRHPMDDQWVWGIKEQSYRRVAQPFGWYAAGEWVKASGDDRPDDDALPEVQRVLYRLPAVLAADEVFVHEGERDVHTSEALGLVATTPSGGANAEWLPEYTEALRGKRVVVCGDNDDAGRKKTGLILSALAGAADVTHLQLPGTVKDLTEWVEAGGTREKLDGLLSAARWKAREASIREKGLLTPTEVIERVEGGMGMFLDPSRRKPGLQTGFTGLDRMTLGLQGGELMILAARPAAGKSALAVNIASNICQAGNPVAIFSLEMSDDSLLTRATCARARVDQLKFRAGHLDGDERQRVSRAAYDISQWNLRIDDQPDTDLDKMHRKLERMRSECGLALVVVDYLQLMTAKGGNGKENRQQEVSSYSRGLKLMAKEFKVPFLVLSQLSRAPETRQGNHRPQLSDLRESGSIEQDADIVAFIYRAEMYKTDDPDLKGRAELILAKQRQGPIGTIDLAFVNQYTRFENLA